MNKQYYKILLYSLYLAAIVCAIYLIWWHYAVDLKDKSKLAPKYYDAIIINQNTAFEKLDGVLPYELPYLRIKNIGFKLEEEFIYLKLTLGGELPKPNSLPSIGGDRINNVYYTVTLDENYFDYQGNKNPGGPEAELKLSLYQSVESGDNQRIIVDGELIKGGPGFDYFVIRYPYQQLLINRNSTFIVFTANSNISSDRFAEGAITSRFRNSDLAATRQDNSEILLDLFLKDVTY